MKEKKKTMTNGQSRQEIENSIDRHKQSTKQHKINK